MKDFVRGWKASYWPEAVERPKAKRDGYYRKENEVREARVYVYKGKPSRVNRLLASD